MKINAHNRFLHLDLRSRGPPLWEPLMWIKSFFLSLGAVVMGYGILGYAYAIFLGVRWLEDHQPWILLCLCAALISTGTIVIQRKISQDPSTEEVY